MQALAIAPLVLAVIFLILARRPGVEIRWGKKGLLGNQPSPVIVSTESKIALAAAFLWVAASILFWHLAPQWFWGAVSIAIIFLVMVPCRIRDRRAMQKRDAPEKGRQWRGVDDAGAQDNGS
jgi:hypothetical protein